MSARMDTISKTANCSHSAAPSSVATSAATAPTTNQIDTSPAVAASAMPKMMMAAIQIMVIISSAPPFKLRIQ